MSVWASSNLCVCVCVCVCVSMSVCVYRESIQATFKGEKIQIPKFKVKNRFIKIWSKIRDKLVAKFTFLSLLWVYMPSRYLYK